MGNFRTFNINFEILVIIGLNLAYLSCMASPNEQETYFKSKREPSKVLKPKFLLILLDGFAASYMDKPNLIGFDYIKDNGVHATYMVPQFPTITHPNLYSILTGRYVENHHILCTMYDNETKTTFDSSPEWYNKAESMWVRTTRAGLRTRVYLWPGCETPINGTSVAYCKKYSLKPLTNELASNLRAIVKEFANDNADVGMVYCEQPDFFGHIFGPNSTVVDLTLRSIDTILQEFFKQMAENNLQDKVNLIVVSDHGMTLVGGKAAKKIALANYLDFNDAKIIDRGATACIYPNPGKLELVYKRLKQMPGISVWKSEEIPEKYHIKLAATAPPIYIQAHKGYYIKAIPGTENQLPQIPVIGIGIVDNILQGFHGYDADEVTDMRGIFMAIGPDFKKNFTLAPIFNTDVYNLAMHVMGVSAAPNDGNWTAVLPALQPKQSKEKMGPEDQIQSAESNFSDFYTYRSDSFCSKVLSWPSLFLSVLAAINVLFRLQIYQY